MKKSPLKVTKKDLISAAIVVFIGIVTLWVGFVVLDLEQHQVKAISWGIIGLALFICLIDKFREHNT